MRSCREFLISEFCFSCRQYASGVGPGEKLKNRLRFSRCKIKNPIGLDLNFRLEQRKFSCLVFTTIILLTRDRAGMDAIPANGACYLENRDLSQHRSRGFMEPDFGQA